ncbi:MAG: DUF2059 domain-containing protein [Arenibacterium sp.]
MTIFKRIPPRHKVIHSFALVALFFAVAVLFVAPARAGDRDRIEAFLKVTGFDVALDSIALSAGAAPRFLGLEPDDFGSEWKRLSEEVFDTRVMRLIALDILEKTLDDDALDHAADFYASDLGQRLVEAENLSHLIKDDDIKTAQGMSLIQDMQEQGNDRLAQLRRMNLAIDATNSSLRALQEIQVRFLMAASAAGVIELKVDVNELRARMKQQESRWRQLLDQSSLAGAAFTYRDFSDADVAAYADALEAPLMQRVYELLNAVQFEIMANRFEILASRMAELHPEQDI